VKLNQLRAFLAVAEHRSIRAAARSLALSQPAVTKTVRELERDFGVRLLQRSVAGIELTEAGQAFAIRARLLVEEMRRARDEIEQIRDGGTGSVAIAVSSTVALTLLPKAFAAFRVQMPRVSVGFSEATLPSVLPRLRDGSLDFVAVHTLPALIDEEFAQIRLFTAPLVVGVRGGHPLAGCRTLAGLTEAEWLLPGLIGSGTDLLATLFDRYRLKAPERVVPCHSLTVALALMAESDLITLFAAPLIPLEMTPRGFVALDLVEALPDTTITIVMRRDGRLTPAAQRFVCCLKAAAP
jgi:LysR family transcriptional regulator of abg operon